MTLDQPLNESGGRREQESWTADFVRGLAAGHHSPDQNNKAQFARSGEVQASQALALAQRPLEQTKRSSVGKMDHPSSPTEDLDKRVESQRKSLEELRSSVPKEWFNQYVESVDKRFESVKRLKTTLSPHDYDDLLEKVLQLDKANTEVLKGKIAHDQLTREWEAKAKQEENKKIQVVDLGLTNFDQLTQNDPYKSIGANRLTRNTVWEAARKPKVSENQAEELNQLAHIIREIGSPVQRNFGFPFYSDAGEDYVVSRQDLQNYRKKLNSK